MIPEMDKIEDRLIALEKRKDSVMNISRDIIRVAGKSITLMHAKEMGSAKSMLGRLKSLTKDLKKVDKGFEYNSVQAHQEYVEACALYTILNSRRIPAQRELNAGDVAYLLGLLDVVGELKREVFDRLREQDLKRAQSYYKFMTDIYDSTLHMKFASAIAPDLRKKQDVARIQIEGVSAELLSWNRKH